MAVGGLPQTQNEVPLIVAVGGLPQTQTAVPPGYCQQETSHNIRKRTQEISPIQTGMSKPNITREGRAEFEMEVGADERMHNSDAS